MATASSGDFSAANLLNSVQVIDPDFGFWEGQYQLKNADISIDGQDIDKKKLTKPQIKLMETTDELKRWKKRFQDLRTEYTQIIKEYTQKFPVAGLRMVPTRSIRDLLYELIGKNQDGLAVRDPDRYVERTKSNDQSVAYRLMQFADEFCGNFDEHLRSMEYAVESNAWDAVKKRIPQPDKIREYFYLRLTRLELNLGQNAAPQQRGDLTANDLQEYQAYIDEQMRSQIHQAVETMVAEPRRALATAITELSGVIQRDTGRVSDASFNAVRQALRQLRRFDFVCNEDLAAQIGRLEERLQTTDADTLTAAEAENSGFLQAINEIREEVEDVLSIQADIASFGMAARHFDFGGSPATAET